MAFTVTKTYDDGTDLTEAQLDSAFQSIETLINTTKLGEENLQAGAVTSSILASNAVTSGKIDAAAVSLAALATAVVDKLNPTGVLNPYAGSSAPSGWLLCDGSAVSRTTYSALFGVVGTTYGAGDGSTTFNLPDLRGRTVAGKDNMGGSTASRLTAAGSGITGTTLGATGGTETHTLTELQMPNHYHGVQIGGGGATAAYPLDNSVMGNNASVGGSHDYTNTAGGGQAHNNTQPTIVLNYIIKT